MSADLLTLNQSYGLADRLRFIDGPGGLPTISVNTPLCQARLCLYGGHVLGWQPRNTEPVIFLSQRSPFEVGHAIRGGVPICWPWFADPPNPPDPPALPDDADLPFHGLVRTRFWQPIATAELADGTMVIALGITDDADTRAIWPHPFKLELTVTFGAMLDMELTTTHTGVPWVSGDAGDRGDGSMVITEALHTYFRVSDAGHVRVHGLDGAEYIDKLDGYASKRQVGPIEPVGGVDYVYSSESQTWISDPAWSRTIRIVKRGSRSTVLFNPGAERAAAMADLGNEEYRRMVCVETANALDQAVLVEAGQTHTLGATIVVELNE